MAAPKRYGRVNDKGEKPERLPGSQGLCVLKLVEVGGRGIFFSLGSVTYPSNAHESDLGK